MNEISIMQSVIAFVVGAILSYFIVALRQKEKLRKFNQEADKMIRDAQYRADNLIKEAELEIKDRRLKLKTEFENETKETRQEFNQKEKWLLKKEENLEKRNEKSENRQRELDLRERKIVKRDASSEKRKQEYEQMLVDQKIQLEKISGMTATQAKDLLIKAMENEARHEGAKLIKRIESETTEQAEKKAKNILSTAIQRYAGDYCAERTVSVVQLPNDEMKGRIIGREGRNIRALEAATGIDLIIDDTPEAVILSGFNPVRREVARVSLMRLIQDGRIHPARIEDIVNKVEKEVDNTIKEAGEQAAFDLGVHGIHKELIKFLGKLKFRTSYSQNVLQHSIEVGFLCGVMAAELGLNQKLARRMGLLHDLGKAVDHEVEGPHALLGSKLAKKYGESPKVVHAIGAHHEDLQPATVYSLLVQAADSLSGARPGARKEILENYVKRLEDLEGIAKSFNGVSNTFAIQAGRELRVIVESGKISDEETTLLSRDIARKIEETLTFPGQIRVMVIRETRAVEYANK